MSHLKKEINWLWRPTAKQHRFLSCPAREVLYGGAKGGGKSDGLSIDPLQYIEKDRFRALILRRRMTDLEKSLIARSFDLYKGRAIYDGQKHRWKFPNGNFIEYGHCQKDRDVHNYDSAEYSYIGIEQAEQFTLNMYLHFFSILRTTNPEIRLKMRLTANPGGVGQEWIKKRFWIGERKSNVMYEIKEKLKHPDGKEEDFLYHRAFIPATVYDNDYLMKGDKSYLMNLLQLPEDKRKAYLEGDWNSFEGQFFKEWNVEKHTCEPFEIPSNWRRYISFDWGYKDSTCVLWFAEEPRTNKVYCYRELYINETIDTDVASIFDEMSKGENIYALYYPWDTDQERGQGVSIHERMDDATKRKYYWVKGNKSRLNGWAAVRHLLALRDGEPMIKIFNTCKNLIRTIPQQVFDDTNSEDLDTLGEDHAVDSLRYFAATYRTLEEIKEIKVKDNGIRDVGGAIKFPDGKYAFKREPVMTFSWMTE